MQRFFEVPLSLAKQEGIGVYQKLYEQGVLSKQQLTCLNAMIEVADFGQKTLLPDTPGIILLDWQLVLSQLRKSDPSWLTKKTNTLINFFNRMIDRSLFLQIKSKTKSHDQLPYHKFVKGVTVLQLQTISAIQCASLIERFGSSSQTMTNKPSTIKADSEEDAIVVDSAFTKVGTALSITKLVERLLPVTSSDRKYSHKHTFPITLPSSTSSVNVHMSVMGGGDIVPIASVEDLKFLEYYYHQINKSIEHFFASGNALNQEFTNEFLFYYRDVERALFKTRGSHNRKVINDVNRRLSYTSFEAKLSDINADNTVFKALGLLENDEELSNVHFTLIQLKGYTTKLNELDHSLLPMDHDDGPNESSEQIRLDFNPSTNTTSNALMSRPCSTETDSRNYFVLKLPDHLSNKIRQSQVAFRSENTLDSNPLALFDRTSALLSAKFHGMLILMRDRFYAFFAHGRTQYAERDLYEFLISLNSNVTQDNVIDYTQQLFHAAIINNLLLDVNQIYVNERHVKLKKIIFALEQARFLITITNNHPEFTKHTKISKCTYSITAVETTPEQRKEINERLHYAKRQLETAKIKAGSKQHIQLL